MQTACGKRAGRIDFHACLYNPRDAWMVNGSVTEVFIGLEVKVGFEINVSSLFGLEVGIEAVFHSIVEVLMENSFVFFSCVWCGVAFLRA
jgi:hypothetical protein